MSTAVYIALVAFSATSIALFVRLPPRRALLTTLIGGFLLLPVAGLPITGLRGKIAILSSVLFPLSLVSATERFTSLRPRLSDLPVALWCICPFVSSMTNNLGAYDGFAGVLGHVLGYGVPYVWGRAYFSDRQGMRDLGMGIFLGGLVYVPFCLWEIRFSPQLHRAVYGFHQHSFGQSVRFGGYRPLVFMDHGLMLGMWMTAACLAGYWLWRSGCVQRMAGVRVEWFLAILFATTVLCKSTGALALLAVGLLSRPLVLRLRNAWPLLLIVLITPVYLAARISRTLPMEPIVSISEQVSGADRGQSLAFRVRNEELLLSRALEKELAGWGGWGRFLIFDAETGDRLTTPDGLWIIALGQYGLLGLVSVTAMLLVPSLRFAYRFPVRAWNAPFLAPATSLAFLLPLYMIDDLLNAMINPIYFLAAGALAGLAPLPARRPLTRPRPEKTPGARARGPQLAGAHERT